MSLADNLASPFTDAYKDIAEGDLTKNIEMIEGAARELNFQFGGARQRVQEIKTLVADTTPALSRLGGTMGDTIQTLMDVSKATRRNVLASTEDVTKLFAASQITDQSISTLLENFTDVGLQFSRIGPEVQQSINYIQSVGANTKEVFDEILKYTDKLNEFNFQGGVQGLTKMATQASVLRFDMQQVFTLADRALDPQKAVELASSFQRLGVSVGDLTDPFQLMYKSLMDPEGLQKALVDMSTQFTFFNEETKTFEISPQGKLMMREIANETGLSAKEMSKLALNAADLERKLSSLNPDINFGSEEDKMLLANIASMNEKGEYVVKVQDKETGQQKTVELSKLDKDAAKDLIELQKQAPKDMEEIQRAQLAQNDIIRGDVRAILQQVVLGGVTSTKMMELTESVRNATTATSSTLERSSRGTRDETRKIVNRSIGFMGDLTELVKKVASGDALAAGELGKKFETLGSEIVKNIKGYGGGGTTEILSNLKTQLSGKMNEMELIMKSMPATSRIELGEYKERLERQVSQTILQIENRTTEVQRSKLSESGGITAQTDAIRNTIEEAMRKSIIKVDGTAKVDHKLDIKDWNINIMASPELRDVIDTKKLKAAMDSDDDFKKYLYGIWEQIHKERNP